MTRLVFDINEPIYPSGDLLIRLTNQMYQEGTTYLAGRPMGTGQIVVDKDQDFVTATNFAVGNYVIVRDLDLSADDADNAVGGFWLEEGDFTLVSDDPKVLTFGGRSTIAVLERAIMGPVALDPEWPDNVTEDGYWRWGAMTYGGVMRRALFEANLQDPPGLPMIETSHVGVDDVWWDDDDDSNGNAWPSFAGEFRTQCGTTLLELYRELYGYGVQIEIDPQSFEMYAFNPDGYGTNRTSATFASGKVRFVAGINIAADLTRSIHGRLRTTHLLVRTTDYPEGAWIESDDYVDGDPVYKRVYQSGDISGDPSASTVLQSRAQRNMDLRLSGEDGVRIPLAKTDFEPLSGKYHAGPNFAVGPAVTAGHFWYGDLITLDTGDHTMDYQDASKRVEAIEYVLREAGDWDVVVHLGPRNFLQNSSITSTAGATGHTIPITLCDPTVEGEEATVFADWTWSTGPLTGGFNNYEQSVSAYVINGVTQAAFTHSNGLNNTEANFRSNGAGTYIPEDTKYWPCVAGTPVNVSCLVGPRNTGFVETRELKIRFENAAGVLLGSETTIHSDTGSGFVAAGGTYTPPTNAVKFRLWSRGRVDNLILSTGTDTETVNPDAGTSHLAARCDHTHPADEHDHDTDYSDIAHAHPADTVVIEDAGGYFTGTDVEAALQELGAGGGGAGLPWYDVTVYGAVGDGSTASAPGFQAAIDAAEAAGGGVVYVPPGTYQIGTTLVIDSDNVTLRGDGRTASLLRATVGLAGSDVVQITSNFCSVIDLGIISAAQKSGGVGLSFSTASYCTVERVYAVNQYDSIKISGGVVIRISNCDLYDQVRHGVWITGTGNDYYLSKVVADNSPNAVGSGLHIDCTSEGATWAADCDFLNFADGLKIAPASGTTRWHFFTGCAFDQNTSNGITIGGGAGSAHGVSFTNCWSATNGDQGIYLGSGASGVTFVGGKVINNGEHGIAAAAGSHYVVADNLITSNSTSSSGTYRGISISAGVTHLTITGNQSWNGLSGLPSTQGYGLYFDTGATDYVQIVGNDFSGNVTGEIGNLAGVSGTHITYLPELSGTATEYLDGTGAWSTPGSTGGSTHWEPVQFDDGSAEWPFVYFNGEIVMAEVPD